MSKLLNILIVVLAIALVAVIYYPMYQQGQPVKVRIACDSSATSLPVLIAMDEGLFDQNKVRPELVFYSDPDSALADLFAGNIDMGIFPWSTIIKRVATKQETLKVFLGELFRPTLPMDAVVRRTTCKFDPKNPPTGAAFEEALKLRRIGELAQLRGKRFGYPPQLRDYLPLMLAMIGFRPTDMQLVEAPLNALPKMLDANQIDFAWLMERVVGQTLDYDVCLSYDSMAGPLTRFVTSPFPGAALGISPQLIKATSKGQRNRIKIALDAAVALSETKPGRAKRILLSHYPSRFDVVEAASARGTIAAGVDGLKARYESYRDRRQPLAKPDAAAASEIDGRFAQFAGLLARFDAARTSQDTLLAAFAIVDAGQTVGELVGKFAKSADTTARDSVLALDAQAVGAAGERLVGSNVRLPELLRLKEIEARDMNNLAARLLMFGVISDTVKTEGIIIAPAQMTL